MGDLSEELSGGCYSVKTKEQKTRNANCGLRNGGGRSPTAILVQPCVFRIPQFAFRVFCWQYRARWLRANGSRKSTHSAVWRSCLWRSITLEIILEITRSMRSIWRTPISPFFGAMAYSFLRTNVRLPRWYEYRTGHSCPADRSIVPDSRRQPGSLNSATSG